jgi:hypothetical protein
MLFYFQARVPSFYTPIIYRTYYCLAWLVLTFVFVHIITFDALQIICRHIHTSTIYRRSVTCHFQDPHSKVKITVQGQWSYKVYFLLVQALTVDTFKLILLHLMHRCTSTGRSITYYLYDSHSRVKVAVPSQNPGPNF